MAKVIQRLFSTLCVGLLVSLPAFAKGKKPTTKPAPPESSSASQPKGTTKPTTPSEPANDAPAPKPDEANAPSGGGGW